MGMRNFPDSLHYIIFPPFGSQNCISACAHEPNQFTRQALID